MYCTSNWDPATTMVGRSRAKIARVLAHTQPDFLASADFPATIGGKHGQRNRSNGASFPVCGVEYPHMAPIVRR